MQDAARFRIGEARKLGITVEQLKIKRLEEEKAKLEAEVAELKKQVAALTAQVDQLKKATPARATAKSNKEEAIAAALKERKIANGMTVEQAGEAVSLTFRLQSSSSYSDYYSAFDSMGENTTGGDVLGILYTLMVKDNRVTSWGSSRHIMKAKPPCVKRRGGVAEYGLPQVWDDPNSRPVFFGRVGAKGVKADDK